MTMARFMQSATARTCLLMFLLALVPMVAMASDADPEQDFCVGLNNSNIIVNGEVCKPAAAVVASDFKFHGLATPKSTVGAPGGLVVTPAFVLQFPGINTLGVGMARLDFAPGGLNPPHTHPRATEIVFVVEGTFYVGFVDTMAKLWAVTLNKGDVFVFPRGLVHFQLNCGKTNGMLIAGFNSQNPGVQPIAVDLFTSGIWDIVLEEAFQIDEKTLKDIESKVKAAGI